MKKKIETDNEVGLATKMMEKALDLFMLARSDRLIYGDFYIEFTDRKIEVIEPSKIDPILLRKLKGKRKNIPKLYGKGILESNLKKKSKKK